MKQEFKLEKIMLKNYKSLQNMMIFLLASMNFVTEFKKKEEKYFTKMLIEKSKILYIDKLKFKEHSIISGIREFLSLNSIGIRDFLRKKIKKLNLQNLCLFEKIVKSLGNFGESIENYQKDLTIFIFIYTVIVILGILVGFLQG